MKALVGRFLYTRGFRNKLALAALSLLLSGCLTQGSGSEAGTDVVADPTESVPDPLTSPERTVCDPFSVGVTARDRGLVGTLVYLTNDQPRYTRVADYINNGTPISSMIYFDKLFVPTRGWDLGFYTQNGTLVTNANDEPVYEYFGLRLETQLMLGEEESPGWYQLALLSDDGAKISLKNNDGSLTTVVDNDGTHATRMGCSSQAVYLERGQKLPAVVEYYQGPRYHISLVAMWRPLPEGADPNAAAEDVQCGRSGNSLYFNSNVVPSAPTVTYYELLTRGWKPLDNENFYFPEQASNPCATEDPLLLTAFSITGTTRTAVSVRWATSLAASTKVEVRNVTTGQVLVYEDPTLVTNHSATVTGLTANTLYAVRAISTSTGGQTTSSNETAFRTPR